MDKISKNKLIRELGMIREGWVGEKDGNADSKKVVRRLEEMDGIQQTICEAVERIYSYHYNRNSR